MWHPTAQSLNLKLQNAETDTAPAYGKRGADAGQLAEEAFFLPPKQVASVCAPLPVCQGRVRLCRPRTCGRATQQARDCVSSVVATRRVVCEILSYEIGPRTSGVQGLGFGCSLPTSRRRGQTVNCLTPQP